MLDHDEDRVAQQAVRDLRQRAQVVDSGTVATLLTEARTHYGWLDRDVPDALLRAVYDMAKLGPTSMNQQPGRYVFVRSADAKDRLEPALLEGNRQKMRDAPVTVIVAHDTRFHDNLPTLFPPNPKARDMFEENEPMRLGNAFRNGTLQGAWLIMAARAHGLDVGPMSGFDPKAVDAAFLEGTTWTTNFLVNLGYGDERKIFRRLPRLPFDDVARIV
ncbi:MAG: malonic semialdehyde reductase [Shimia sp.]